MLRYWGQLVFSLLLIFGLATVSGISYVGFYGYRQTMGEVADFMAFRSLQKNLEQSDSLAIHYADWSKKLRAFHQSSPEENHASHVMHLLVDQAKREEIILTEVTGLNEIRQSTSLEYPFELSLRGGFPSLVRYMHALESQDMVLRVRRFSIHSEAMHRNDITARFSVSVFLPSYSVTP